MPMYDFKCPDCGNTETVFRHIDNRSHAPECCGLKMDRIMSAPMVQADTPSYQSPIDGRWIDGKRQRQEDMKRNKCRPWEGMENEKKHAENVRADSEKKLDKALTDGAINVLNNMSADKRRVLTGE